MPIGDSVGTIMLATSKGMFYAMGQIAGPYYNAQHQPCWATVEQFVIGRYSQRQPQDKVVCLVMPAVGFDATDIQDTFKAVAPHILKEFVESSHTLPVVEGRQNFVDVHAWLKDKQCESVPVKELAAHLDDGKAEYNRLCRADVLRILFKKYDEEGSARPLKWNEVAVSPLRRRYYEAETVNNVIRTLQAEQKIKGTRIDCWIDPSRVDELREEIRRTEMEFFGDKPSPRRVFEAGETSQAWQELRNIVRSAKQSIWLADAWLGSDVVALLGEDMPQGVSVRVLGPVRSNRSWSGALESLKRLGQEISNTIEIRCTEDVHDRFICVDGNVRRSSESFKDMASKRTTWLIQQAEATKELIESFEKRWTEAKEVYSNYGGGR